MRKISSSAFTGSACDSEDYFVCVADRSRWSLIAGRIPGRTDNEIKNYWNTHLSKKLIGQGIDPRNHKPLNPSPTSPTGAVNNINFVAVSAHPRALPPRPNALALDMAMASQHQPISVNVRRAMDEPQSLPVAAGYGNWILMGQLNATSQDNNMEQTQPIDGFDNDETFSSFLDTLMNDNFPSPYPLWSGAGVGAAANIPQPLASTISPTIDFNRKGDMWDAELVKSALETL